MRKQDVGVRGWYNLSLNFQIIETQVVNDVRMAKCLDESGREFYLEIDDSILPHLTSSALYYHIAHSELEDIIKILQASKCIFALDYKDTDGKKKEIVGNFVTSNNLLGHSIIYSLKTGEDIIVDNRNIMSLTIDNIKYYKLEESDEEE